MSNLELLAEDIFTGYLPGWQQKFRLPWGHLLSPLTEEKRAGSKPTSMAIGAASRHGALAGCKGRRSQRLSATNTVGSLAVRL